MACINSEQVRIFAKFRGDADGIERVGSKPERDAIGQSMWTELMQFRQRLLLLDQKMLSDSAELELLRDLRERFCDEQAVREFSNFVRTVQS